MGIVARKQWRFEPVGESTRVSFTLEYDPKPPVIAPLADVLLMRRKWDQIYERGMQNLKRVIEAEPTKEMAAV
jgi:ribosome-associated toxin RatA of RatAB toxin-antitoxin module